ncbi:MAG: YceI family protein [Bacteroidetes bacterium]|nr:MAG: YceI family protein [Bacteroidota bacterium]MBL1145666.1 YceI family protein [Bacteroidota bacterium]NOG58460.1 YceI family protein [Bacteroidota bacterium]
MKKINLFAIIATVSVSMISCGAPEEKKVEETVVEEVETVEPTSININLPESSVMWKGRVLGMHSHHGTVAITEGTLEMAGDVVTGGKFTIDMKSINPTDSAYSAEKTPEKLVGHLSSADFFLVDSFPTASFVIKSADLAAKTITGDLTVRGTTNEEVIENVMINQESGEATGKLVFDRQAFGVAFTHPLKDVVISNDIELDIKLKM